MFENSRTQFEPHGKDWRVPRTHETMEEIMTRMNSGGWRLLTVIYGSYGALAGIMMFWEHETK